MTDWSDALVRLFVVAVLVRAAWTRVPHYAHGWWWIYALVYVGATAAACAWVVSARSPRRVRDAWVPPPLPPRAP